MRKQIAIGLMALAALSTSAFGGVTLIFNDNNTGGLDASSGFYAPGASIVFDIFVSYSGTPPSDLDGMTLYLESLRNGAAQGGVFTITSFSRAGSLFTDGQGATNGLMNGGVGGNDSNDLGAGQPSDSGNGNPPPLITAPGNYLVGRITLTLGGAVVNGDTYTLQSIFAPAGDAQFAHGSVASNRTGSDTLDIPTSIYTVNVIPEPATWSLIGLGGLAYVGVNAIRRRRRS